jgi:hypothetical protein
MKSEKNGGRPKDSFNWGAYMRGFLMIFGGFIVDLGWRNGLSGWLLKQYKDFFLLFINVIQIIVRVHEY